MCYSPALTPRLLTAKHGLCGSAGCVFNIKVFGAGVMGEEEGGGGALQSRTGQIYNGVCKALSTYIMESSAEWSTTSASVPQRRGP